MRGVGGLGWCRIDSVDFLRGVTLVVFLVVLCLCGCPRFPGM